ncbi:MAG: ATP-binding protein [Kiritimatiellae bacterium]|nr:ATP-binding protein [Kiritimatiellia bacterium]MDW8458822.1 ATP-binding protein [Verrucomicrobiota bacterium]
MWRRTLFWKLWLILVSLTLLLSWIQAAAQLPPFANLLLLALMATVASAATARFLARPLDQMRRAAQAQAAGEPNVEWPIPTTREMHSLSNAVQTMALNLQEKIHTIEGLLAEQRAIFESMAEGLLVVDTRERLLDVNRAAQQMLGIDPQTSRGREFLEVVRNTRLAELIRRTLRGNEQVVEGDAVLLGPRERYLQVRGTPLRSGARIKGALVVLSDVTRIRQLEAAQREFVANASHELKTPVTSIKGFAETLAGEDMDPEQMRRFTKIIARHAEQLGALIDDLLELTRLEHEGSGAQLECKWVPVREVIENAVDACASEANQKNISVSIDIPEEFSISAHPLLLQRALVNLIDNAIKYSSANTGVRVRAERDEGSAKIHVIDQGVGIAPEHHERIFERFYRVDKSRSRKLGGTGLGLSIVKHIVDAHGGKVTVSSAPGKGSTFTITLKLPQGPGP